MTWPVRCRNFSKCQTFKHCEYNWKDFSVLCYPCKQVRQLEYTRENKERFNARKRKNRPHKANTRQNAKKLVSYVTVDK